MTKSNVEFQAREIRPEDASTLFPDLKAEDFRMLHEGEVSQMDEVYEVESFWRDLHLRLRKHKGAMISLYVIVILIIMAIIGPLTSPYSYKEQIAKHESMAPRIPVIEKIGIFTGKETIQGRRGPIELDQYSKIPDGDKTYHYFGTDVLGRDIYTRTWMGTRISLYIALLAVLVDVLFGLSFGMISGFYGGRVDMVMQRILEVINGIPSLVVVTLMILILKPGLLSITVAIALTGWIGMARMARAEMLKMKNREFVLAARSLGARPITLMYREILPNIFSKILIMSMFSIPNAIFMEAFLAFIGIGIPMPMASLGSLINENFKSLTAHPYMIIPPVLVLALLMLGFNLLADGLRDALDPSMKEL
ncbi:MAG: ABC transporter permease [Eubacteriales bacterium]|nr:ABC transporter permease [Eubacteriales bacterium]